VTARPTRSEAVPASSGPAEAVSAPPYRVEAVPPSATWALRQAVLRPHEPVDQMALRDDDDPSTGTFAALFGERDVVGTVRVALEPPPLPLTVLGEFDLADRRASWRLRGMAVAEDLRNSGIGTALLARAIDHVTAAGGGVLWCNARLPAVNLYRRAGLAVHGEPWNDPDIGPHVVMWRLVRGSDRTS